MTANSLKLLRCENTGCGNRVCASISMWPFAGASTLSCAIFIVLIPKLHRRPVGQALHRGQTTHRSAALLTRRENRPTPIRRATDERQHRIHRDLHAADADIQLPAGWIHAYVLLQLYGADVITDDRITRRWGYRQFAGNSAQVSGALQRRQHRTGDACHRKYQDRPDGPLRKRPQADGHDDRGGDCDR